jgi:hypothetical protein
MSGPREPVPFEMYKAGVYLHGTKADPAVGEIRAAPFGRRTPELVDPAGTRPRMGKASLNGKQPPRCRSTSTGA